MNKDQIREALEDALRQRHDRLPATEQMIATIAERVLSTLDPADPATAAFVAELEAWIARNNDRYRRNRLGQELLQDRQKADLQFIHRLLKRSHIYEQLWYWWAPRQILLQVFLEEVCYSINELFERYIPEVSTDPTNVYLDKLIYDTKLKRFRVEGIPAIDEWCKQHIHVIDKPNLVEVREAIAIPFTEGEARQLQSMAASVQEFCIPGFPDVSEFLAEKRRKLDRRTT
jgi:hypothetical protein